jgi:hypothetical protein
MISIKISAYKWIIKIYHLVLCTSCQSSPEAKHKYRMVTASTLSDIEQYFNTPHVDVSRD